MSWVFFSVAAAFLWAIANVVDKFVLSKWGVKPIVIIFLNCILGLISALWIFWFLGWGELTKAQLLLALVAGIAYVAIILFYLHAVSLSEISRVVPLFYFSPLFIAILAAIFLGEIFAPVKYLGIALLVIGAMLISLRDFSSFHSSKAFYCMVLSALALATAEVIAKYLLSFTDYWHVFAYLRMAAFLAILPVAYLCSADLSAFWKSVGAVKKTVIIGINEFSTLVGVLFITVAAGLGFITLVNALAAVQPFFVLLFTVLIGLFLPRIFVEELGRRTILLKFIAILCMFIGGLIVS